MESKGRILHVQANQVREIEGNLLKSLQLTDEALIAYQQDGDKQGLSELIAERAGALKHLFQQTGDEDFVIIAKAEMEASVAIASKLGNEDALAIPYFNLAKIEDELNDYTHAVIHYKEAVKRIHIDPNIEELDPNNPAQNRPAMLCYVKAHLHYSENKTGDESALDKLEEVIKELEQAEETDEFIKKVWLSGSLIKLAELLKKSDQEKGREVLKKAEGIIESDERLHLRKGQLEKLKQKFNS